MAELELVTFEQAKALDELGFPREEDRYYYSIKEHKAYVNYEGDFIIPEKDLIDALTESIEIKDEYTIPASTLELVAKWLRDEKKIYIDITWGNMQGNIVWCASLNNLGNGNSMLGDIKHVGSYEEALSAGIDKAIEILKVRKTNESKEEHLV